MLQENDDFNGGCEGFIAEYFKTDGIAKKRKQSCTSLREKIVDSSYLFLHRSSTFVTSFAHP